MTMTEKQLRARDAKRDLGAELLESVRQMKRGAARAVYSPVVQARANAGLTQAQFARILGVSIRTLQSWEQGRKQPSGAARTLITIARLRPEVVRELHYEDAA